jgi:hypothetical protein
MSTSRATGWPFLVASGRRRDYSTLMAPGFLVADLDYGILNEVVEPSSGAQPPAVIEVRTPRGRDLSIVYATHLLTAADLVPSLTGVAAAPPRDEHNRPLRLIYGFASRDSRIAEPAEADLARARAAALEAYRPFLANEDALTVVPSDPFELDSVVTVRRSSTVVEAAPPGRTTVDSRRTATWLGGLAVVVCAVVVGIVLSVGHRANVPPDLPCASPRSTPAVHVTAGLSSAACR